MGTHIVMWNLDACLTEETKKQADSRDEREAGSLKSDRPAAFSP